MLLLLSACFPPWIVIQTQEPSPALGAARMDLAPLVRPALRVTGVPEAEYVARLRPEDRDQWIADLGVLDASYRAALTTRAARCGLLLEPPGGPGRHTVATEVTFLEPGFYAGMVSIPSEVRLRVQITRGGKALEAIELGGGTDPGAVGIGPIRLPTAPAVADRFAEDGTTLGELAGEWLCHRKEGK